MSLRTSWKTIAGSLGTVVSLFLAWHQHAGMLDARSAHDALAVRYIELATPIPTQIEVSGVVYIRKQAHPTPAKTVTVSKEELTTAANPTTDAADVDFKSESEKLLLAD